VRFVAASREDREKVDGKVHLVTESEANRYRKSPAGTGRKRYMVHALCTRGVAFPTFEDWQAHPVELRCQGCAAAYAKAEDLG
jgi:hypothetical protein